MECQTLPSTSSLSGGSGDGAPLSMAPRRRTTLPKAAVFILPKRTHHNHDQPASSSDFPSNPPTSPMPSSDTNSVPLLPQVDYDAMDVDYDAGVCQSPLHPQLRGRVRHLPRDEEPISSSLDFTSTTTAASPVVTTSLPSRRPRRKQNPDPDSVAICVRSGLRQVLPPGVSVSIGNNKTSAANANAVIALSVKTATQATATACAYDAFVTSQKPSLWKRFTRRVKASVMNGAPKPTLNISTAASVGVNN